jgi:hypothetical protein
MSKSSRKIMCYSNPVDKNEIFLHPITLELVKNKHEYKICPTEIYKEGNELLYAKKAENTNYNKEKIQSFMALPYINFNIENILDIYNVSNIDTLLTFVNKMIEEDMEFNTINRVLNLWIKNNFDDIIDNHNIIVKIIDKLLKHFKKTDVNDIDKRIKNWFESKNVNDFYFNLISELNI